MEARAKRVQGGPHPVDIHIGRRLRARRKLLKISQTVLAESVGMTFPQIQKYEAGANRISASTLYDMASVLKVSVEYFYLGLPTAAASSNQQADAAPATLAAVEEAERAVDGAEMADIVTALPFTLRRRLVTIAREISAFANEASKSKPRVGG
jgi:transcriptional regulator with XRE-family HTH domain